MAKYTNTIIYNPISCIQTYLYQAAWLNIPTQSSTILSAAEAELLLRKAVNSTRYKEHNHKMLLHDSIV
jgi:hypothetical protein